jgi:hypothetical protein
VRLVTPNAGRSDLDGGIRQQSRDALGFGGVQSGRRPAFLPVFLPLLGSAVGTKADADRWSSGTE